MKTVKMYSISDLKRSTVQIKLKMTSESKGPRTKMLLVYVGATDENAAGVRSSIFVRGPLLSLVIFSFIWTVDLFRSDMLYIFTVFTWFCPCLQCCFHMALSMYSVYG